MVHLISVDIAFQIADNIHSEDLSDLVETETAWMNGKIVVGKICAFYAHPEGGSIVECEEGLVYKCRQPVEEIKSRINKHILN